jgi:hypothetical protein
MNNHYTEQDFLDRLYEVGRDDDHLDQCAHCRQRMEEWMAGRQVVLKQPEAPVELLAGQRRRIFDRIENLSRFWQMRRWAPAAAVAMMALFVVFWKVSGPIPSQPPQTVETASTTPSDAQLMAEIYRTVYETEPAAVEPLRGLFEVKQ